jgi:hypothetical protein
MSMPHGVGGGARVDEVLARRAVFAVVVVLPVLHEKADDVVALLLEEPGAHGRVDSAREAEDDGFLTHRSLGARACGAARGFVAG